MLGRIVDHLRAHEVSFRLTSRPSPEALPAVAEPLAEGALAVHTWVLLVDGEPAIACAPRGTGLNLRRLAHELGAEVSLAGPADLSPPFDTVSEPVPPIGSALGAVVLVDERVAAASSLAFEAFETSAYFEVPYAELARLEQPRVASLTGGGELGPPSPEAGAHV